jgi:hypothetical protein
MLALWIAQFRILGGVFLVPRKAIKITCFIDRQHFRRILECFQTCFFPPKKEKKWGGPGANSIFIQSEIGLESTSDVFRIMFEGRVEIIER